LTIHNRWRCRGFISQIRSFLKVQCISRCFENLCQRIGFDFILFKEKVKLSSLWPNCRNYSQSITKKMQSFTIFYFCKTLYMFQTVFPSIIRSSKLHIQRQVFVRPIPDAVCTVLSWWTENPSETRTAPYRNKEIVKHCILLVILCEYISDARTYEC